MHDEFNCTMRQRAPSDEVAFLNLRLHGLAEFQVAGNVSDANYSIPAARGSPATKVEVANILEPDDGRPQPTGPGNLRKRGEETGPLAGPQL